jgi:hypothetical protein
VLGGGDWTGWLGRQDSNLCISEFAKTLSQVAGFEPLHLGIRSAALVVAQSAHLTPFAVFALSAASILSPFCACF